MRLTTILINRNCKCKFISAQTMLEYAVLVVVVTAAFLGAQIYFKRAIQGSIRESAEGIGEQYSPKHTLSATTTYVNTWRSSTSTTDIVVDTDGNQVLDTSEMWTSLSHTAQEGTETVGPFEDDLFD